MDAELLRELQQRGRFFYEMFPGAMASGEWRRHRNRMEEEQDARLLRPAAGDRTEKSSNPEQGEAVLDHALVVGPPPHEEVIVKASTGDARDPHPGYRIQGTMRQGTASSLEGTWPSYLTIEEAREAARKMLRDDRVLHLTVVEDTLPPRFVEWVKR